LAAASLGSTSSAKPTLLPLTTTPVTICRSTTLAPRAGSITRARAARTCSLLVCVMVEHSALPYDIVGRNASSGSLALARLVLLI
jgi:hypothetical protein